MGNNVSYVVCRPYSQITREDFQEVFLVELPEGFRKSHVKVTISCSGVLTIRGERPEGVNRRNRFEVETKLPWFCKKDEIEATYIDGTVKVTMPKSHPWTLLKEYVPAPGKGLEMMRTTALKLGTTALKLGNLAAPVALVAACVYCICNYQMPVCVIAC
ncbi:inactive protein RESTRICTED TEV MOVEMENT 2-like [Melia azedarach]|uniref:Inactive protein RESTRICTED TEV MOVEMENT 2-like n=1 Tax=Melia azedarach TaxID=155640 RepID=A0ACC1YBZ1_MELAZ|nr:inactive protein RESTRICTED TEV MOVEMENT 2-like [Melia azedarach]